VLDKIKRLLGIAVQFNNNDLITGFQYLGYIVQSGIFPELLGDRGLRPGDDHRQIPATRLIGANEGDSQKVGAECIGILCVDRHYKMVTPWVPNLAT